MVTRSRSGLSQPVDLFYRKNGAAIWILALTLFLAFPPSGDAYAVLSHEAIIDTVWGTHIVPLLKRRFPEASPDELRQAHAYAYGGAIIQDMGYYPFGSAFFSNLTHYVRSGDFIEAMLRDAHDINEYAFAVGSMSHYAADNDGHRLAVNRAVPVLYPGLRSKYGDDVTFEDSPLAHVKTEFGFDVVQVAKQRYAPDAYRDFIGFEVAQPLLEKAFRETYGLELSSVLEVESKAIGSYRHDVSKVIPRATRVAWQVKQHDIQKDLPGMTRDRFLYNLSRASYEKRWGADYRKPGPGEKLLAFLFRLIPKIGPLKILAFRTPTPETERLFEASFDLDQAEAAGADVGNSADVAEARDVNAVFPGDGEDRLALGTGDHLAVDLQGFDAAHAITSASMEQWPAGQRRSRTTTLMSGRIPYPENIV
jgi:hypothetical protein